GQKTKNQSILTSHTNYQQCERQRGAMMEKSDHELGMDRSISRRDFLDGVAVAVTGAAVVAAPVTALFAATEAEAAQAGLPDIAYPPMRNGMRGFSDDAMNAGHALRDGVAFDAGADTGEVYDLVVVGSGMAGFAAAYYYKKQ